MVRVGEVEAHAGLCLDLFVVVELGAVVGGDGLEAPSMFANQPHSAFGQFGLAAVSQFADQGVAGLAFDQVTSSREIRAALYPCVRRAASIYLSPEVIWRYVMSMTLFLPEKVHRQCPRSPRLDSRPGAVHLLVEFATANNSVKRTAVPLRGPSAAYLGR